MVKYQHIVLSRTDNIGDVVLTLPMAVAIKTYYPNCKISVLARDYVKDVVSAKKEVDNFISYDSLVIKPKKEAIKCLKEKNIDIIIHVSPNKFIAKLAKKAHIPIRVGNFRKLYNLKYCNKFTFFSRAKSNLHESQLNLKMLKAIKIKNDYSINDIIKMITLEKISISEKVKHLISNNRFNLVLHPLSNGNGREWPLSYYKELIDKLPLNKFNIIISGTEKEYSKLKEANLLNNKVKNAVGNLSLLEFISLLSNANAIVIASTGPLHISAALGTYTIGLFPPDPSAGPHRWKCIGKDTEIILGQSEICYIKCSNNDCICMRKISVENIYNQLMALEVNRER